MPSLSVGLMNFIGPSGKLLSLTVLSIRLYSFEY
jgi:hypothetical protein